LRKKYSAESKSEARSDQTPNDNQDVCREAIPLSRERREEKSNPFTPNLVHRASLPRETTSCNVSLIRNIGGKFISKVTYGAN